MAKKKRRISAGTAAVIRTGVATGLAGAYYFLGPQGKQHQKTAKAFVKKLKGEWGGTKREVQPGKKKQKVARQSSERKSAGRKRTKTLK